MAFLAAVPAWVGTAMAVAGAVSSIAGGFSAANAAKTAAQRQKTEAEFEAEQMTQAAGQAIATSQRDAIEQRRQARLLQSRAIAISGASGASVTDPTVLNLIGDIAGQGSYRAAVALYQGEDKARQLNMGAAAKRYEGEVALETGRNKARAYQIQGITGALGNTATMFGKYGGGGPGAFAGTSAAGGSNLLLDTGITNPMIG